MYFYQHKPKNKIWGRPGNEATILYFLEPLNDTRTVTVLTLASLHASATFLELMSQPGIVEHDVRAIHCIVKHNYAEVSGRHVRTYRIYMELFVVIILWLS